MNDFWVDFFSFLIRRLVGIRTVRFGLGVRFGRSTRFEGNNNIGNHVHIHRTFLGKGSYIAENSILNDTWIGRYTCIGSRVYVVRGQHPTGKFVSIHPAFFSAQGQAGFSFVEQDFFSEYKYIDKEKRYAVKVGNDVWIGSDVKILEGTVIHDGAVIACGAVVTKDVMPYEVVGGVPAKHIKFRFSEKQRKKLLENPWWEKEDEWLRKNVYAFHDIEYFERIIEKNEVWDSSNCI